MDSIISKLLLNPLYFDLLIPLPLIVGGIGFLVASKLRYAVSARHVAVSLLPPHKKYLAGWHWGVPPRDYALINLDPVTIRVPLVETEHIEIKTPDDGVLGAQVTFTYQPNDATTKDLITYHQSRNLESVLTSRIHSALISWAWQKPLPATSRRAVASKADAERAITAKLTSLPTDALVAFSDVEAFNRYSISDLGISVRDVHLVKFWEIKQGTGKANWGDGEEAIFNAQVIFKQFQAGADNLSSLRKLKESLIERYPDEADDIEDIYDQVRISMKESRG